MTFEVSETKVPDDRAGMIQIGQVLSVRGSEAHVGLPGSPDDDDARATVGTFLALEAGPDLRLVGMITQVAANLDGRHGGSHRVIAVVDLMGEIKRDADGIPQFRRGVAEYPAINDKCTVMTKSELALIFRAKSARSIKIGHLHQDSSIPVHVDVDSLLSKHFAVLGSTGVGKSSGVAAMLGEILEVRTDLRVFLLDGHNEYGNCFGDQAHVISPKSLKLPFWLFNFEEFCDVIYAGRPGVDEEIEILAELIPIAKSSYTQYKSGADRLTLKRQDPRTTGFTVDTPVPYLLQDLVALIDEQMGKLDNRTSRMNYNRLMLRIETIRKDPRYGFMFDNANVGGDTMAELLSQLFRLEHNGKRMSIMQLAGLPVEVVDAVVCLLCRLAFYFGLWSDGAVPLLFICEEAHRYASSDPATGFGPTRRALSRIAKEGRKYGVYLGLVTQRPAELDPTIISQCNTMFAMRMANDRDQALLRSAVSDAAANLLAFVPSLGTREVVAFGEGVPLPARLIFRPLAPERIPRREATGILSIGNGGEVDKDFVQAVIDRWRGTTPKPKNDDVDLGTVTLSGPLSASTRLDQARYQILKR